MPTFSGSFSGKANSQTLVSLKDVPDHDLMLAEISGPQQSSDDKWNDAKMTYWGIADLHSGSGSQHGYWVNEHTDGDRDWGSYEGKVTATNNGLILEGNFTVSGGTGKFNGISGSGTYKGHMPSPSEVQMTWEGAYQLPAKAHAG